MNIIEAVKAIITSYPKIAEFSGGISIDYTENTPENYGLYSVGDTLKKEDLLGDQTRQHSFILYANKQSFTDYNRLCNSSFLLELSYWLDKQSGQEVEGIEGMVGEIQKITTANAMLYSVPTGGINGGVTYQLQINVEYFIES